MSDDKIIEFPEDRIVRETIAVPLEEVMGDVDTLCAILYENIDEKYHYVIDMLKEKIND